MNKLKELFTIVKSDPMTALVALWIGFLSVLVVAGVIKLFYAAFAGTANFENITLF